jgi:8-amino-7-oxononanoate synthase
MDFSKKLSSLKQSHLYRSRKISENAQNTQLIINGAKRITTNHPCDFKII